MMKLKFNPEDFPALLNLRNLQNPRQDCADMANEKLEKYIKEYGHRVYYRDLGCMPHWAAMTFPPGANYTEQAILINIEEIPKKECKHTIITYQQTARPVTNGTCGDCGVKLKVKWEVEK